jgi:hypothetical protein
LLLSFAIFTVGWVIAELQFNRKISLLLGCELGRGHLL